MPPDIASVGDAGISAGQAIESAARVMVADSFPGMPERNDAISAMCKPMENTPSIKDFLMKCPLSLFNA